MIVAMFSVVQTVPTHMIVNGRLQVIHSSHQVAKETIKTRIFR